ncbi:nicotinamide riboside transporter PnuC [Thiomicrorhabdus indica]|uniref:nicotinamide riboside transporter PnuC n=1 Tax=Thiomicrorhabdus indica TaxID=2267253 RepID=UPI002AA76C9B|nr:nicotinamide riboside transporter PnuC [Thiomicrorhabdus indica]
MIETIINEGLAGFAAQSPWEWLAALFGIGYVVLAARENPWAWPSAFISTLIYTLLFWQGQLPLQSLLNLYYLIMALYGWQQWKKGRHGAQDFEEPLEISKKPLKFHLGFTATGAILSFMLGTWMHIEKWSVAPFLDAGVMIFSVMTTYLMVKKILENWLYWLVIDTAAIILYWQNGYYPTMIMFMLYLVLATYGYIVWKKTYAKAHSKH